MRHGFLGLVSLLGMAACSSAIAGTAVPNHEPAKDRSALWRLVSQRCALAAEARLYPPAPCAEVAPGPEPGSGYAVLKDKAGQYQYLLIPLKRVSGVEDPALLAGHAENYFAEAWTARAYVEAALHGHRPRDQLMLAVNSQHGRSQDQLHIHIDCVRPDVHEALLRLLPTLSDQWQPLSRPLPPLGHTYVARWVNGESLSIDPFASLAASLPPGDRMASHSMAVVGAESPTGQPGFVLLSGKTDLATHDPGSAEELEDHQCAISHKLEPPPL